jgi:hypothetical protein
MRVSLVWVISLEDAVLGTAAVDGRWSHPMPERSLICGLFLGAAPASRDKLCGEIRRPDWLAWRKIIPLNADRRPLIAGVFRSISALKRCGWCIKMNPNAFTAKKKFLA